MMGPEEDTGSKQSYRESYPGSWMRSFGDTGSLYTLRNKDVGNLGMPGAIFHAIWRYEKGLFTTAEDEGNTSVKEIS